MGGTASRWIWLAAALAAGALAFVALRERTPAAPPAEEIDDASQEALREILRQEGE